MSLIQEIRSDLKTNHPEIFSANNNSVESLKSKLLKTRFSRILLFYLFLITSIIVYTKFLNFDFLKILTVNFEDNIKSFSTSIITLVSMNLFVTNLLLTHLKDERDDLQSIIDKRVNFKFITYLGFTIILSILCLYFLSSSILNIDVKSNILILIFVTFIFYILQLVTLYNSVFNFINKLKRTKIISAELDLEFSKAFYNNYLKSEFKKRYEILLETERGFTKYFAFSHSSLNLEKISLKARHDLYLVDINISSMKNLLDKIKDDTKFYSPLDLNMKFNKLEEKNLLFFSAKQKLDISKYYILRKQPCLEEEFENDNLLKLLAKVQNNTLHNKFTDLRDNLDNLDRIYSKYMMLQKKVEL